MNTNDEQQGDQKRKLIYSYIWNTDWAECAPTYLFFLLRDDQFTSVGFQSTIVLYTQEHSNTLCWGIKTKKYPWKVSQHRDKNAEQIFFRFQLDFMIKPEYSFKQTQFQMDTLCDAHLGQSRDLFSLFENIPAFGEHLYYADVITAIVSFSDSKNIF